MFDQTDREAIKAAAQHAVVLLICLGAESYDEQTLATEGDRLVHSPLAGKVFRCTDISIAMAGPYEGEGNYHVIVTMRCDAYPVEAYCIVTFVTRPILIKTDIRVGSTQLSGRNVSIRNGKLEPRAMPRDFNLWRALQATDNALAG